MFFLFRKGIRVWFVAGVGMLTTMVVLVSSLSTPVELMKLGLKDISLGKELEVLSLVFHGFAIPHSRFLEGETYESLLDDQPNITPYYYHVVRGDVGTVGFTVRKEVFPTATGRLFVLNSLDTREEIYALPFNFPLGKDWWDAILFWNRVSDVYYVYFLQTYQTGETKVYLFNSDPALTSFPDPEKETFPFVWNPSLLELGKPLDLPGDFDVVWAPAFTETYNDLLKLIRFISNLN